MKIILTIFLLIPGCKSKDVVGGVLQDCVTDITLINPHSNIVRAVSFVLDKTILLQAAIDRLQFAIDNLTTTNEKEAKAQLISELEWLSLHIDSTIKIREKFLKIVAKSLSVATSEATKEVLKEVQSSVLKGRSYYNTVMEEKTLTLKSVDTSKEVKEDNTTTN